MERAQGINYIKSDGTVVLQPFRVNEQKLNSNNNPQFGAIIQGFDNVSAPLLFYAVSGEVGANAFVLALAPATSAMEAAAARGAAGAATGQVLDTLRVKGIEDLDIDFKLKTASSVNELYKLMIKEGDTPAQAWEKIKQLNVMGYGPRH